MFDFEKFNNELDEQNAALESLLADLDDAGDYSPVTEMLEKVSDRLENCTTAEECYDLLDNLNVEIGKFNDSIEAMKTAAEQFQLDNDKDALAAGIAPAVESLTNTYNIISMENVTTVGDAEIQTLRDFLTGSNALIQNKYDELNEGGYEGMYESYLDFEDDDLDLSLESYFDDDDDYAIAEEGIGDKLKAARDAVIKWLKGLVARLKAFKNKLLRKGNTADSSSGSQSNAEVKETVAKAAKAESKIAGLIPMAEKAPDSQALQEVKEEAQEVYNEATASQKAAIRSRMNDDNARRAGRNLSIKEQNAAYAKREQDKKDYLANMIADKREGIARNEAMKEARRRDAEAERAQKERDDEWADAAARVKAEQDAKDSVSIRNAARDKATMIKKKKAQQRYEKKIGGKKKDRGGKRRARYAHESYVYDDDMEFALEALEAAEESYYGMYEDDYDYEMSLEAYNYSFDYCGTEQDFIDCAMEGIMSGNAKQEWQIRYGEARKELVALTKSAKKARKAKDYKKAIAIYKKVEAGYRSLLKVAKNMPDRYSLNYKSAGGSETAKGQSKMRAIEWVNNQISNTQAAIMDCQNRMKKAARKSATESFYGFDEFDDDDLDLGLESMYDDDFESFDFDDDLDYLYV